MRPDDLPSDFSYLPCGTRAKYVARSCRCAECRKANTLYERQRAKARIFGRWNGLVSADVAKARLEFLSCWGVGRRSVAAVTGLSQSGLALIRSGRKQWIRADTERRILAVDARAYGAGHLLPAGPTWKLLDQLVKEGYTKMRLAQLLGRASNKGLQFRRDRVTAKTAMRVQQLYWRLKGEIKKGRTTKALP